MNFVKNINLVATSREEYRRQLITIFLDEAHGSAEEAMCYNYYVDTLSDATKIYLKRPTALNKGVDFEVRVEGVQFRYGKYGNIISTGNRPSHGDIYDDLANKKQENPSLFQDLLPLYEKVYACQPIASQDCKRFQFDSGHSVELILNVLKWLFIEQDITYWNRSGREMLYNGIRELWVD